MAGRKRSTSGCGTRLTYQLYNFIFLSRRLTSYSVNDLRFQLYQEALLIPNMCHPDVPTGPEAAAKVVREFGGDRREGSSLVTAEIIGNYWKSVIYPREACGNRSYAFIGLCCVVNVFVLPTQGL